MHNKFITKLNQDKKESESGEWWKKKLRGAGSNFFTIHRFARERPCKDTVKKAKKIAKHAVNLYRATNWETWTIDN